MTPTATHPAPRVTSHPGANLHLSALYPLHGLARLGARVSQGVQAWLPGRRQTEALTLMDAHLLQDVGAPHWLRQRALARRAQDCYEYVRAMSRLKY